MKPIMNDQCGDHEFIKTSAAQIIQLLNQPSPEALNALRAAMGATTDTELEQHRQQLLQDFSKVREEAQRELPPPYVHYASRIDIVGLYQSALAKVFGELPQLQGYGDHNPMWVVTKVEELAFKIKTFFHETQAFKGGHRSGLQAIVEAWKELETSKAPYPKGTPETLPLPETCDIALMADWGGDNPAAKRVAGVVAASKPAFTVHLGDIYYGGVREECQAFLRNWPVQAVAAHPGAAIPAGTSFALNGNHEMYSGGESFFNIVLPAFGQAQPFFCLENQWWRVIGLDTAYLGGRLKPQQPDDPMWAQWNWLIELLKDGPRRANIFLSHHQPVSAHTPEFRDSATLRADAEELLAIEGIGQDAIFGWFFGHEHRCTVYRDDASSYNARLIGSGCIPHSKQTEETPDSGCTPFVWVSGRGEDGTQSAVSQYASLHFMNEKLEIVLVDESGTALGSEQWDATAGRLHGVSFKPNQSTFLQS